MRECVFASVRVSARVSEKSAFISWFSYNLVEVYLNEHAIIILGRYLDKEALFSITWPHAER